MIFSAESLAVLVLFVLPGFAAFYAKQYVSAAPQRRLSAFEESLYSLLYGIAVFVSLSGIFAILVTAGHYFVRPTDFPLLIQEGLGVFFQAHPIESLVLGIIWVFLSIGFGLWLGVNDPIEQRYLRSKLSTASLLDIDPWYYVLQERHQQLGREAAYARIRLKSGELYEGFVHMLSLHPAVDGSRYIALDHVVHIDLDGIEHSLYEYQSDAMALLSSKDIESIQVLYEDRQPNEDRKQ